MALPSLAAGSQNGGVVRATSAYLSAPQRPLQVVSSACVVSSLQHRLESSEGSGRPLTHVVDEVRKDSLHTRAVGAENRLGLTGS